MQTMQLGTNQLQGPIPSTWTRLTNLSVGGPVCVCVVCGCKA
jgi:hypothetical protein